MRTEKVVRGNVTVIVRSAIRRTPIIESTYAQAIRDAYPEIPAFEKALFQVPLSNAKTHRVSTAEGRFTWQPDTEEDELKIREWTDRTQQARFEHGRGNRLSLAVDNFVPLAARIISASGTTFKVNEKAVDSPLDADQVVVAFNDYLDDDGDVSDLPLWLRIQNAINLVDRPLTPATVAPPDTLSGEQASDRFLKDAESKPSE